MDTTDPGLGPPLTPFNVVVVAQAGRLQYEAALFCASFRAAMPDFPGRLFAAEPQPGPRWRRDPRISDPAVRALLDDLGAEILPFETPCFGEDYPHGNKIELLAALPPDAPFVFFDSDTLILGDLTEVPFDFDRPSASLRVEATWPRIELYGPGYAEIWKALYDRFGLDFDSSLDLTQPEEYWRRHLYFNAGFFYHRSPRTFGARYLEYARTIRDDPPAELVCQSLDPWLDQVALPLVIHGLGGGRDALPQGFLDGSHSCHYRHLPLLYAREEDRVVEALEAVAMQNRIKKVLKTHEPMRRMIYQGKGEQARALFDRAALPRREQAIRSTLKREKLWLR
ncbi:hypothetical protein P6F26_04675 [Roseibacterium sp. SDUM158017]|uniref:hypothetical protein n=1 Tax=Roseicyclus salinarum TaxID=3036773 RepID=UPI002414DE9E|nr:hypothetical protein [Roseibacterium sp. SDUM158017]MDG4647726.1 hypothetical protein [Roseibacterium sp. SDUM158017]